MTRIHPAVPDLVSELPPPPTWGIWVLQTVAGGEKVGKFSPCQSLQKAKGRAGRLYSQYGTTPGHFYSSQPKSSVSWRIYEWVDGAWVERHQGEAGELKSDNPLFTRAKRVGKGKAKEEDVEEALASIMRAISPIPAG